jgi:hypothetical protein
MSSHTNTGNPNRPTTHTFTPNDADPPRRHHGERRSTGNKGEIYQRYYKGMEDQLGALGLVLNCVTLWNYRLRR